jgi:hypothetical protein
MTRIAIIFFVMSVTWPYSLTGAGIITRCEMRGVPPLLKEYDRCFGRRSASVAPSKAISRLAVSIDAHLMRPSNKTLNLHEKKSIEPP